VRDLLHPLDTADSALEIIFVVRSPSLADQHEHLNETLGRLHQLGGDLLRLRRLDGLAGQFIVAGRQRHPRVNVGLTQRRARGERARDALDRALIWPPLRREDAPQAPPLPPAARPLARPLRDRGA
jgi:hypothetical protein